MKKYLGTDPLTGVSQWMTSDDEGIHLHTSYDKSVTKAVFDQNSRLRGQKSTGELRLAGSIPPEVIHYWLTEYGVNIFDPAHKEKARKLYNSSDFSKVRINDIKL